MTSGEAVSLEELVRRYTDNRSDYRSGTLNETQTRREFIDPLLDLLGWDVSNRRGYAEAYKSVIHEDHLTIEGRSKAPDYSFRVGLTRKFFLEAKRPSVNIATDPEPAYQLRRYAWSAKLPLSILCNVEHIAVYDCRFRPAKEDKAQTARIALMRYDEYVDRWEELVSIFSLDAVNKGSFDRFAAVKSKKGTTTVDEAFLNEIERWREILARAIFHKNPLLKSHQLNDAVQKTIDRIVFLRIAEDLGIEPDSKLASLLKSKQIYSDLCDHFRQADRRYNSGLFHFRAEDGGKDTLDNLTLTLTVDNKPLHDIITNLYPPKSPYEFRVIPSDILGQIYERFLGKRIYIEKRSIKIDDKPEVKKAGGVYYTPLFVVKHVVDSAVQPLLEGKSVESVSGSRSPASVIRIIDPACGSGSFLIGVYQYLLDWYLGKYCEHDAEKNSRARRPRIIKTGSSWRLSIAERRRILTTHIFGVDIDPQAVEVTKLSLLLKVLEGESKDAIASQSALFNERVLPDLDRNIKCGNSLIQDDFFGLFDRDEFSEEQLFKINTFTWRGEFPEAFRNGGFDAVVGNPPYGAVLMTQEQDYLRSAYPQQNYQLDTYMLFVERSVDTLLRAGGMLGFIIPNPWLSNVLQTRTRQFVLRSASVKEIVHFTFPVFKKAKAVVDTEIVVLRVPRNESRPVAYIVDALGADELVNISEARKIEHNQEEWINAERASINIFLNEFERRLTRKIATSGPPAALTFRITVGMKPYQVGKGVPKQSKEDVEGRVYDSDSRDGNEYRPYLRGADIVRFGVFPGRERFIRYGPWLAEPRLSARFDHNPKIVMRQTGDSLVAAIDRNAYLCMNNMHVLVPREESADLYFFSGLLNSKVLNWYFQSLNPEMGEALAEVKKTNVELLPFPVGSRDEIRRISGIARRAESIVATLRAAGDAQTKVLQRRQLNGAFDMLNQAVYSLFKLTDEERSLIELAQRGHTI